MINPHDCAAAPRGQAVTLLNGSEVCICSREWMAECAEREETAKRLLQLPLERRREALGKAGARNPLERQRLEDTMTRIFNARKAKAGAA